MSWYIHVLFLLTAIITANGFSENKQECYTGEEEERDEPFNIPEDSDHLLRPTETNLCRGSVPGIEALKCGGIFILQKCVCSYHHVSNDSNHGYTACPDNSMADSLDHLTCDDCKKYSIGNRGPCLNNGTINCSSRDELASDIYCSCPDGFSGRFCENKTVKLYRICHEDPTASNLPVCGNKTKRECKMSFHSGVNRCSFQYSKEGKPPCRSESPSKTSTIAAHHVANCCRTFQMTQTIVVFSAILQYLLNCYI